MVCESFVDNIIPKPHIYSLDEVDSEVKVADGRTLPYRVQQESAYYCRY